MTGLKALFTHPKHPRQRQYEALRAIEVDGLSVADAAKKFDYTVNTLYSLIRDVKAGKLEFFPQRDIETKQKRTPNYITKRVIQYRKDNLSADDIAKKIAHEGYKLSTRTVERILTDANFPKLKRRTRAERGLSNKSQ